MSKSKVKHNKMKCSPDISNKKDRSNANRKLRRIARILIKKGEEVLPNLRDISDPWNFTSDGLATYTPIIGTKWERR